MFFFVFCCFNFHNPIFTFPPFLVIIFPFTLEIWSGNQIWNWDSLIIGWKKISHEVHKLHNVFPFHQKLKICTLLDSMFLVKGLPNFQPIAWIGSLQTLERLGLCLRAAFRLAQHPTKYIIDCIAQQMKYRCQLKEQYRKIISRCLKVVEGECLTKTTNKIILKIATTLHSIFMYCATPALVTDWGKANVGKFNKETEEKTMRYWWMMMLTCRNHNYSTWWLWSFCKVCNHCWN